MELPLGEKKTNEGKRKRKTDLISDFKELKNMANMLPTLANLNFVQIPQHFIHSFICVLDKHNRIAMSRKLASKVREK